MDDDDEYDDPHEDDLNPPSNVIVLDPMKHHDPMKPGVKCNATSRTGKPCGNFAIKGTTVCRLHGGAAPQVKRAAQLRLLELIDPAIGVLAREMERASRSADRQRAANSILDRAGVVRTTTPDADLARALLIDRLRVFKATGQ